MKQTVLATKAGSFPPASFWNFGDAMAYSRECQKNPGTFGIIFCPVNSFETHYKGTVGR